MPINDNLLNEDEATRVASGDLTAPEGESEAPPWYENAGKYVGDVGLLGLHGLTMGLSSKIAKGAATVHKAIGGDVDPDAVERAIQGDVEGARANTGAVGVGAEIAGGLLLPIPGMGVGKAMGTAAMQNVGKMAIAKSVVPKVLEAGVKGAGLGAVSAAAQTYGETPTGEMTADQLIDASISGAKWGGALGAIGHGAGEALAGRAKSIRYSAAGADAGQIRKSAKKSTNYPAGLDKDAESLRRAQDDGLIGHLFQASPGTVARTDKVLQETGQRLESMYKGMDSALAKNGAALTTTGFHNAGVQEIANKFGGVRKVGPAVPPGGKINLLDLYDFPNLNGTQLEGLQAAMGDVVQFTPGQKVSASEIWKKTQSLSEAIYGLRGDEPVNNFRKKVLSTYRNGIREMTDLTAARVSGNPTSGLPGDFAANFKKTNEQWHDAKLVNTFGLQGITADEGKHYLGMGMRGIVGAATAGGAAWQLKQFAPEWAKDPLMLGAATLTGGVMAGRRGRMANTELSLARTAERYFPATAKSGGVMGGKIGARPGVATSEDEMLQKFFDKERTDRNARERGPKYSPRSPLNSKE